MHQWSHRISLRRKPRYLPLRYRFILLTSLLLTLLVGTIAFVVSRQQSRIIRDHVEQKGLAIAQSLAATSKTDLTTYNYIALSQVANQATQDSGLVYVIIHDKEGRVAAYSGRADLQGQFLQDPLSLKATSSQDLLVQTALLEDARTPILDIAVQVLIPASDRSWGTIRVALSLAPMYAQIRRTQLTIASIGFLALILAILISIGLARRITNPLGHLVNATIRAAQGDLNQEIRISTGDEVGLLADNFSIMIREVLAQRRQLEWQLAEITGLQRYMNKLLTTMNDGLLTVNMEGESVTINPAARTLLMLSENEIESSCPVSRLFRDLPELFEYIRKALENPYSAGRQVELQVRIGQELKTIIVASSTLTDRQGNPQQIIINLHDVTELKKLESRFRQTERLAAMGTLAAGMAHEIRNPLSAIKTFVQLLPRKIDKPGFLEKFNRTVPRELERINRLIEDLLELARTPKYRFDLVDLGPLLQQAIDLFEDEMERHQVSCHLDISSDLPLVWADADQLMKALNNLIQNAIQSMQEGGQLTIRTLLPPEKQAPEEAEQRHWINLVFGDTGMGISPENLPNIFNPFFTTKDTGTGLGLAITHKVITEHNGLIEVRSTPGEGTHFTIRLPAKEIDGSGLVHTWA